MIKFMTVVDAALDKALSTVMLMGYSQEDALVILRDVIVGRLAQLCH